MKHDKQTDWFLQKYNIRARSSHIRIYDPPRLYDFRLPDGSDPINYHIKTREVPAVELVMPDDSLSRLVELDSSGDELLRRFGPNAIQYVENAQIVLNSNLRESKIRKQNPAVQLAWEKYQMLLKIAGE